METIEQQAHQAFGSLLMLGGRVDDLLGGRRALVLGLAGFAGSSAIGGAADSFVVVVAARALQGTVVPGEGA